MNGTSNGLGARSAVSGGMFTHAAVPMQPSTQYFADAVFANEDLAHNYKLLTNSPDNGHSSNPAVHNQNSLHLPYQQNSSSTNRNNTQFPFHPFRFSSRREPPKPIHQCPANDYSTPECNQSAFYLPQLLGRLQVDAAFDQISSSHHKVTDFNHLPVYVSQYHTTLQLYVSMYHMPRHAYGAFQQSLTSPFLYTRHQLTTNHLHRGELSNSHLRHGSLDRRRFSALNASQCHCVSEVADRHNQPRIKVYYPFPASENAHIKAICGNRVPLSFYPLPTVYQPFKGPIFNPHHELPYMLLPVDMNGFICPNLTYNESKC